MSGQTAIDPEIAKALELDHPVTRWRKWRRWLVIGLAAAVLAIVAFAFIGNGAPKTQYETEAATRGDLTVIVTATGTLQPTNEVDVGSELSGIVASVEADFNDHVRVGQVLVRLDTSKMQAQVTQSRAALAAAEAQVLQARATLKETRSRLEQLRQVRELSGGKVPAQADLDAAEAAFARAEANEAGANAAVAQARATLEANQTDLGKAVITSPIEGIVLSRQIEPGQTVAASFTAPVLFTLAEDLTQMELHVNVDEADISKLAVGQGAQFSVAAHPDRSFQATIKQARFGSSTTSGVVTYETVLAVDNADLALRPGMTATADITVQKVSQALLIPNAALRYSPPLEQTAKKSNGSLVGALMPGPGRLSSQRSSQEAEGKAQRVWTLVDGKPTAIVVTTGVGDGSLIEVLSGGIQPGTALIVDAVSAEK